MRLKVQEPAGQRVITIDDEATVGDLLQLLKEEVQGEFRIRAGFPPAVIDFNDRDMKLGDVGIRAGDKLIVEPNATGQITEGKEPVKAQSQKPESDTPHITMRDGTCVLRRVPDDNSCMFRSISYSLFHNLEEGSQLRTIVADTIRSSNEYNSAILGKPKNDYISWIQLPNSWGGAIELQILGKHFGITIKSLDVENDRIDEFNPGCATCMFVLYSGIHYDTVVFSTLTDIDDKESDVGVFQVDSSLGNEFESCVRQLGKKLNNKGYVTNTNKFKIKCMVCDTILTGERHASEHASSTGHYKFGEV